MGKCQVCDVEEATETIQGSDEVGDGMPIRSVCPYCAKILMGEQKNAD